MEKFFKAIWEFLKDFFGFKEETKPPVNPGPRVLEKGMEGEDVLAAQKTLKALGLELEADGKFGPETENAVIKFQEFNGIGKTGAIGPQTAAALLVAKPMGSTQGQEGMLRAAAIAEKEAERMLVYTGVNSEAEKYLATLRKALGMPTGRYAWCGAFVYWCCKAAGVVIPAAFPTGYTAAYCPGWEAWAKSKKCWYPASLKKSEFNPRRGDIVLFNWDGDSYADHIGIVLAYDPINSPTMVKTAEGNTSGKSNSNGDQTSIRARDWGNIRGFIRFTG